MALACPGFSCRGDQAAAHLLPAVPSVWACLTLGWCLWVEANENTGDVNKARPCFTAQIQKEILVLNSLSANHREEPVNSPR